MIDVIVIGGSAGALGVLGELLSELAVDAATVIALHLPPGPSLLPEVLSRACGRAVAEPEDKQPLVPGDIYVAPADYHLLLERGGGLGTFALSIDEPVRWSRPSIDVLFESAARAHGRRVAGVVLSGANDDGASGVRAIVRAGGAVVVQDPASAAHTAMPAAAVAAASRARADLRMVPPSELARTLVGLAARKELA